MRKVMIGKAAVSGLCIGGNPFSGFSHQSQQRSEEMAQYYTPDRIRQTLQAAEQAGVNTFFGRTDDHILGIVKSYREQGGAIQWFAQVSQDWGDPDSWRKWLKAAIALGATGAYIHGGVVDFWYAHGMTDCFKEALDIMREAGVVAGFAAHRPDAHQWIREHLEVDFQMCSHYNPTDRSNDPHHKATGEKWDDEDRARMMEQVAQIQKPVVHYKVFAGGNKPVLPAFQFLATVVRPQDVVLVGIFTKDNPDMISEDVSLFETYIRTDCLT